MRHSDIFDEFAKIAQEKGLISKATPEEIKKKLEENPRMDSLDISAIEALYGVTIDTPPNMKYKRNIIDDAHPNPVVVSPAYDKLNGLVENVNERQDIIMNIVKKRNNGNLTQKKYAEKQLLLSLVRIGNDLDNKNKTELRTLSDVCLEQTSQITKKAQVLIPLIGIPAIFAVIYAQQHLSFADEGFKENTKTLITQIDNLLNSNTNWGIGAEYTQDFLKEMRKFRKEVLITNNYYEKVLPIIKNIEKIRTVEELAQFQKSADHNEVMSAYKTFRDRIENFSVLLNKVEADFKDKAYKFRQIKDKGFLEKAIDWFQVLHGGWGLIADKFDDVNRAITPYKESIKNVLDVLEEANTYQEKVEAELSAASSKNPQDYGTNPYASTSSSTSAPVAQSEKSKIDEEASSLEQDLRDISAPIG